MKVKAVKLDSLQLDPKNARKHSERNLAAIKESLSRFGQRKPIVVRGSKVLAGNGTLEAARQLGWTDIQVAEAPDNWDEDTAKAYALADNRSAELAEWDEGELAKQLLELENADWDIVALGFELPELRDVEPDVDEVPEPPKEPIAQKGQVWQLGKHRLMCGDSTSVADMNKLMDGNQAHLIFTDPPWNVNYGAVPEDNPMGYKNRTILNDFQTPENWRLFVEGFVKSLHDFSLLGAPIYLVMSAQEWPVVDDELRKAGFHWSSTIIWAKDRLVLSRKDYHTQYEPIWYGWKSGASRLVAVEDRKQSDVWQMQRPSRSDLHPTTKPVELIAKALLNSSKRTDAVLDAFGGSGSTLMACEQHDRRCFTMELDPAYCDVIIKRWEDHTGLKAELVSEV